MSLSSVWALRYKSSHESELFPHAVWNASQLNTCLLCRLTKAWEYFMAIEVRMFNHLPGEALKSCTVKGVVKEWLRSSVLFFIKEFFDSSSPLPEYLIRVQL